MNLTPEPISFVDVTEADIFYREIMWLAQQRITTGWADGTFRPYDHVDRGATAAFFYRLAGSPAFEAPETPSFKDVDQTHPFYKEIEWLKAEGITTGWADGTFRPFEPIKRDAMAAFFYRYAGEPSYVAPKGSQFVDVPESTIFYREIMWLRSRGITTGWGDGTFRPYEPIKRDAMAAFIYRYVHNK
ncbi:MAG TPA: S-layer homology domain-containing protein [Candidatus Rothia avicola]|uniref:S-layer homology domain-containing protein n=1 Tax=Candidatus Rothia avicola TaxID=2840478 RepID=A0A9D2CP29_9MICC|nr:S-layer homology domain-containing protein [Candidatus Rothia avicola]